MFDFGPGVQKYIIRKLGWPIHCCLSLMRVKNIQPIVVHGYSSVPGEMGGLACAASLLGTSILSFLKWTQHYFTSVEDSTEKIHVKILTLKALKHLLQNETRVTQIVLTVCCNSFRI